LKAFFVDHAYRIWDVLLLGALVAAIVVPGTRYWMGEHVDAQQSNIYLASSAASAPLLGFMVAALTILLMLNTSPRTELYETSGLYRKTMMLFLECAVWLAALTVASIAGLFIDPVHNGEPARSLGDAWIWLVCGLGIGAAWRLFYSLYVLRAVMTLVAPRPAGTGKPRRSEIPTDEERTQPL
jgi:hypothetical protein